MDNALSDIKYIKYKNKLLMPLYMELTSLIKHMNNTEISKLQLEFKNSQAELEIQRGKKSASQFNEEMNKLENIYN